MADGRHFENRKYAIIRPRAVRSSPNFAWRRRYRRKFEFFTKNCENMKIKDGGRPPFENRKYAITRPHIVRPDYIYIYNMASRGFVSISWASCFVCHASCPARSSFEGHIVWTSIVSRFMGRFWFCVILFSEAIALSDELDSSHFCR